MQRHKLVQEGVLDDWDSPKETRNPRNWSVAAKTYHTVVPCLVAFLLTFATSVPVSTTGLLAARFDVSRTASLLPLTLYTAGLGLGPLFGASLSEIVGRKWVYVVSVAVFMCFMAGAGAAQHFADILVCRFLGGLLGSAGVAMGAGSISDVFRMTDKAGNMASLFFILGPFLGPTLGPLAGAYIVEQHGQDWRWSQWLLLTIAGPILIGLICMKETAKVAILREENSTTEVVQVMVTAISRPVKMLCTDPIVLSLTIYTAYAYAMIFSFFASASYVLRTLYSFNVKEVGLSFISVILGYLLATLLFVIVEKTFIQKARKRSPTGLAPPEYQLIPALIGSVFIPLALFWYAWEAHYGGRWVALVASGIPLGLGTFSLFLSVITYMVSIYPTRAASALAANGLLRYVLGAVFPLFTFQMYERLGVHWASSVFAFLSLALLPIPWLLYRYGPRLRGRRSE